MRIGIAGQGFGLNLLHTVLNRADCEVAGVSDHLSERLAFARSRGIPTWTDDAAMIREAGLDAVVLSSAPHVRGAGLEAAMAAGIPVFMEKPIAGTAQQAREIVKVTKGHPVFLAFSFRFHAPVQRLLAELPGLGAPRILNGEYLFDWLPDAEWLWNPEKGGGFFTENSCHLFDVVRAVMGRPARVYAAGYDDGARPSATGAAVTLGYASGAVAALTLGGIRGAGAPDDFPRLDLACATGRAQLQGHQHMWTGLNWARRGEDQKRLAYWPETLGRTRYSDAFDHFFAQIAAKEPFAATPQHGLEAVELAEAVYASIRTGQPVDLGETT
ncbi:Gfo/Idh/MocA family protein [Oceaniglobus trochenteri]|uniref:Gfo/Idh/MocA family protein n=1 Tax=Oceaniglobus trochenteri TaxID=2763260 RepID=UPI001CFFA0BD|nr:Gfo/Idh/MocA family oxidoreductase [Oceaniglobus trochenteri]